MLDYAIDIIWVRKRVCGPQIVQRPTGSLPWQPSIRIPHSTQPVMRMKADWNPEYAKYKTTILNPVQHHQQKKTVSFNLPSKRLQGRCETVHWMSTSQTPDWGWQQLIVLTGGRNEDEWINDPQTVAHKQAYQKKKSSSSHTPSPTPSLFCVPQSLSRSAPILV